MMLHTDAFNKNAKNKMSKSDYLKNTSSSGVPTEILEVSLPLFSRVLSSTFSETDPTSFSLLLFNLSFAVQSLLLFNSTSSTT